MIRTKAVAVLIAGPLLFLSVLPGHSENLARSASYSVVVSGFAYRGQTLPGTNTPAVADGYVNTPPWQGPMDTLTDGRRDGNAVVSWFWSNMDKRITVRFDLRRLAAIAALRVWPRRESGDRFETVRARVAGTAEELPGASELPLTPESEGFVWQGGPAQGRFVEVVCGSGAPLISLSEVEIEGEVVGPIAPDAPPPGLLPEPKRDLTALVRLPERSASVANVASRSATSRTRESALTMSSRHYDDKAGAWVEDKTAAQSDAGGRALIDGDPSTAVRSFEGWYSAKTLVTELDLGKACRVERVIVWSAGHESGRRSYLNAFNLWLQAAPDSPWVPAGETRNPILPGEKPGAEYAIVSPVVGKPARRIRLEFSGAAQSADVMEVGEIEVWARSVEGAVRATRLRVKKPVPPILPVRPGKPSPALDWILKERVRALFCYIGQWKDTALLDNAVAARFNALLVHTMSTAHSEEGWPQEAAEWARVQRERNLKIIISWPFGSDERYGNTQFGAYQPGGPGRWTRTPCPLSKDYWEKVVGDRAVIAARAGLTGMVVDMEMYGADSTRYPGPCYCDACFNRFIGEHLEGVRASEVALASRPAWMSGNSLAADYARWQELNVSNILRGIERRVHAVSPRFLLGNLLDPESLPGLARGFGTATLPALIFSELEYHGNVSGAPARLEQLKRRGYPALYVPGFWIQPVIPPDLPRLVREVGPATSGYWIWSSVAFAENAAGEYAHAKDYSHDDYWRAFRESNDALDASLESGRGKEKNATPAVPQALVPRVRHAPESEADWEAGARLEPFGDYRSGAPRGAATHARALWDGKRLYLRIVCEEPTPEKSPPARGGRDDGGLWEQDSIEVFWRRPAAATYAHLVVNAAGTVCDSLSDGLRPEELAWNADIRAEALQHEKGWELVLSIPVASDGGGTIPPGGKIRFEIARNRPGAGETTCWAPTHGMFRAAPELWGVITLQ